MAQQAELSSGRTCGGCTRCDSTVLQRLGIDTAGWDYLIALAGNPNTGKSTIFNALTGLRQHVGNWPGKTVTRAEGAFRLSGRRYKVVDLPGTYSLLARSTDEQVARDFLLFGRPDVAVVVVDASVLERNLNLALQVLEVTDRAVVALNLIDEAARKGIEVDSRSLARDLGMPVVPMAARRGVGVPELLSAIDEVAIGGYAVRPVRVRHGSEAVEQAVATLAAEVSELFPGLPNPRWVALRLLEGDETITAAVRDGSLGNGLAPGPAAARPVIPLTEAAHADH